MPTAPVQQQDDYLHAQLAILKSFWIPEHESSQDKLEVLGKQLEKEWLKEIKEKGKKQASLFRCLVRCFGASFAYAAAWELIGKCVFGVLVGVILGFLVSDIQTYILRRGTDQLGPWAWNSLHAIIIYKSILLCSFLYGGILSGQYYLFHTTYVGMKCRIACTYLIYHKILKMSLLTLESTTSGQIMNLISNDVSKFETSFYHLQYLYIAPIHSIVIFTLLIVFYLGLLATLSGLVLVAAFLVLQFFLGKRFGRLRSEATVRTDERVRVMGELIDSISIIKMYAWENYFESTVTEMRNSELAVVKKVSTLRTINLSLFYGFGKLVLMIIFVAYLLMGNEFNAGKVFTAIVLTNGMRTYLTLFFPYSVAQASELTISMERIRLFLIQDDLTTLPPPQMNPIQIARAAIQGKVAHTLRERRNSILITPAGPIAQLNTPTTNASFTSITSNSSSKPVDRRVMQLKNVNEPIPVPISSMVSVPLTGLKADKSLQKLHSSSTCNICAKFDNNRLLIEKKFAIIFHEVNAAWPRQNPNIDTFHPSLDHPQLQQQQLNPQRQQVQHRSPSTIIFNSLTAHIKHHEFVIIVGRVGSGKSSLLMTILNELPIQAGSITINGSLSYASQEPWLFAGSIRENITIAWHKRAGRNYQKLPDRLEQRYKEVLRICCLDRDLARLPEGDMTLVGERGTSLSGGQKARVNLARALFYEADIYLLDDPLSAVDAAVAKYIFDECFKTFLKRKTVLLVTHQVQFSTPAQKVLLLYDSPEFSYGPANKVLQTLFQKYNIDPKAAIPVNPNEERAVVPVSVVDPSQNLQAMEPLGEIDSLSNIKSNGSDEFIQTINSDDIFNTLGSNHTSSPRTDESMPDAQRQIKHQANKSIRSPSRRLLAEASVASSNSDNVDFGAYLYYSLKAASIWVIVLFIVFDIATQALFNGTDFFLSEWSSAAERKSVLDYDIKKSDSFFDKVPLKYMCLIYTAIISLLLTTSFARNLLFFLSCFRASKVIHEETLHCVLNAPMTFFNQNSIGYILARFSTDLLVIDDVLPQAAVDVIEIFTNVIGILLVSFIVSYYNILPAVVMLTVAFILRSSSERVLAKLRQMEALARGRASSYVISTLHGLSTIRVFRLESVIKRRFEKAELDHTYAWYSALVCRHRLTQAIDLSCLLYLIALIIAALLMVFNGQIEAGKVGLLITQVIILPGPLQWGVRQLSELHSYMSSIQRVREYTHLKNEQYIMSKPKMDPPDNWPDIGAIRYDSVTLSYVSGADVLSNISFEVKPGERIGIVGRTGAGKSSIINALFRLTDFRGRIFIDNIDTKCISLKNLRSAISIIPQEPVLFSGTIRHNLDPYNLHKDDAIWSALNSVRLKKMIAELDRGLEAVVAEGGHNFSVGQRQLICLARAILRKNILLVLDEATANVDPETDNFIQTTIRELFKGCTVLTIAHRLHTIMDSDRVLVLDASKIKEFDEPHTLLQNPEGFLTRMVNSTGPDVEKLKKIAKNSYNKRRLSTDKQ